METVYDIHQFTSLAVFYYTLNEMRFAACNTLSRLSPKFSDHNSELEDLEDDDQYITEDDDQYVTEDDDQYVTEDEDEDQYTTDDENYTLSSNITDSLYDIYKKGKAQWNKDDISYLDGIVELIADVAPIQPGNNSADHWHYAIIVPSSWEEEIRDEFIRPLFIQANLISKEDHKDRLIFYSEIECIFYYLQDKYDFQKKVQTFISKIEVLENNDVFIRLDLVQTVNPLFTFSNSKFFPKVLKSTSFYITSQDFKDDIRLSLIDADLNQIEENVVDVLYSRLGFLTEGNNDNLSELEKNKIIEEYEDIDDIFGLCNTIKAEIGDLINSMLSNTIGKKYEVLTIQDLYSFGSQKNVGLAKWVNSIQNDNISFVTSEEYESSVEDDIFYFSPNNLFHGAFFAAFEMIKNSDIFCPPRILDKKKIDASSVETLNSNPDVIIAIDILSRSTELSLSLLNNCGMVERIYDHNHFKSKNRLHCLSSFYATLNGKDLHLNENFTESDSILKLESMVDIEYILSCCFTANNIVSSTQKEYTKKYILLYLVYIKEILSVGWPKDFISGGEDLKVGYTISIEKILLDNLIGTRKDFEELIFTSGLVQRKDTVKNLIVITKGEGVLPVIQRCLAQDFPLKSYFLLAQLHEDYIQLSLNQVVTSFSTDNREQESVICQDEIIPIRNLYESLSSNIWENLNERRNLIKLCIKHQENKDNAIIQLFIQKNKLEFKNNLKKFICDNILVNNSSIKISDGSDIHLNSFCNCKVHLTVQDLIEVSFKPVLKEIATIVSASLINDELFGKYIFVQYAFTLIHFNENAVLQSVLQKILQEEAQDFNEYQGIETKCLVIPQVANQLLQPVIKQQAFLYKGFQMGLLRQVYYKSCCFSMNTDTCTGLESLYKNKLTDLEYQSFTNNSLFPFFEEGDMISDTEVKKVMYFKLKEKSGTYKFNINYHECEPSTDNQTIALKYGSFDNVGLLHVEFNAEDYSREGFLPVTVSFKHNSYSSSINFSLNEVGDGIAREFVFETGEPMTLSRF